MKPRIVMALDEVLALSSDPQGPIGEFNAAAMDKLGQLLGLGYRVEILTWRDPAQVAGWFTRAKYGNLLDYPTLSILPDLQPGQPLAYVFSRPATLDEILMRHGRVS